MLRSLAATSVQFAVAFLIGLPIFAAFKLVRRVVVRDDVLSRPPVLGDDSHD